MALDHAAGNAEAAHVTVLDGIEPKEAIPFVTEDGFGFGFRVPTCVQNQLFYGIKGMQLAFDALLFGQIIRRRTGGRSGCRRRREVAEAHATRSHTRKKSFKVAFLLA